MTSRKTYWNRKLNESLDLVRNKYVFGGKKGKSPYKVIDTSLEKLQNAPTLLQEKFIRSLVPEHVRCLKNSLKKRDLEWADTIKLARQGVSLDYIAQALALDGISFVKSKSQEITNNFHEWYSAYEMVRIDAILKLGQKKKELNVLRREPDLEGMMRTYKP